MKNLVMNKKLIAFALVAVFALVSVFGLVLTINNVNGQVTSYDAISERKPVIDYLSNDVVMVKGANNRLGVSVLFGRTGSATVQWYKNTTMSYDNATSIGSVTTVTESSISTSQEDNQSFAYLALDTLDVGNYYFYAKVAEGTYTFNSDIVKVEVKETQEETEVINNIRVDYKTIFGTYTTYNSRIGEYLEVPTSAPTWENHEFVGWYLNGVKLSKDSTKITADMVKTDSLDKSYIQVEAMYESTVDTDKVVAVTVKEFKDGFLFFDSSKTLFVKNVAFGSVLPDMSDKLDDTFAYFSFDKDGKDIVADDYKIKSDVTIYANYKGVATNNVYKVTYKSVNPYTSAGLATFKTLVFEEGAKFDLSLTPQSYKDSGKTMYFSHWAYDVVGEKPVTVSDTVTADTVLYGVFTEEKPVDKVEDDTFFGNIKKWFDDQLIKAGVPDGLSDVLAILCMVLLVVIVGYLLFRILVSIIRKIR